MKKTVHIIALLLMISLAATAQTEKGRWTAGVSVGSVSYQDYNSVKQFAVNLTPSAGYFIKNNLLIGTGVPLSLSTYKTGVTNPYLTKTVTVGVGLSPFVRYYFGKSAFKPFAGLSYSYTYTHYTYEPLPIFGSTESASGYSTYWIPTIGLAYFINRSIAVNASLNYTISESKAVYFSPTQSGPSRIVDNTQKSKIFSLGVGFQLFFGK